MASLKIILTLLILIPFGRAQVMSPSVYTKFLKRLDGEVLHCKTRLNALRVESLPVSYAQGKFTKEQKDSVSKELDRIHGLIGDELARNRMSTEIKIVDGLGSVFTGLVTLASWADKLSPEASENWLHGTSRNSADIAIGKIAMVDHLTAKADELQSNTEKCKP